MSDTDAEEGAGAGRLVSVRSPVFVGRRSANFGELVDSDLVPADAADLQVAVQVGHSPLNMMSTPAT